MYKENVKYMHNRVLFNHKSYETLLFAVKWIDLEVIVVIQIIKAHKSKHCRF